MKDRENYIQRASDAIDRLDTYVNKEEGSLENVTLARVGFAQALATFALAESQRLLAETLAKANTLKRIELGLGQEPLPAGSPLVAKPGDPIPSVTDLPPAGDLG